MTEQPLPANAALAVSPSLSLRQAARPLIFAHALLKSEQALAKQLADECNELSRLTTEVLEAAALAHLVATDETNTAGSGACKFRCVSVFELTVFTCSYRSLPG
jgi:hypothetical protein